MERAPGLGPVCLGGFSGKTCWSPGKMMRGQGRRQKYGGCHSRDGCLRARKGARQGAQTWQHLDIIQGRGQWKRSPRRSRR